VKRKVRENVNGVGVGYVKQTGRAKPLHPEIKKNTGGEKIYILRGGYDWGEKVQGALGT